MAQWEPNLVDPKFGSYIMSLSMISVAQTASARRARELATTVSYDLGISLAIGRTCGKIYVKGLRNGIHLLLVKFLSFCDFTYPGHLA